MQSPNITANDGSTINLTKQGQKKNIIDDQNIYSNQFDQLFLKQRNYMGSEDVKAIQNIPFKKESFVNMSMTEIDMTSFKQSKDYLYITNAQQGLNESSTIENKMIQYYNNENNHHTNYAKKKSFLSKDVTQNGDDQFIYSQDVIDNTNQYSPGGQNTKKNDKSPQKQNSFKGTVMTDRINEDKGDFLKAMQGVGNIFRFYGIIQPKMKRFFFTKTNLGKMRHLSNAVRHTINDIVDFQHLDIKRSFFTNMLYNIYYLFERLLLFLRLDKIPIFNPENKLKIIFNCIIVTYNCFYLLLRSLQIFFHADYGVYDHHFHTIAEVAWVTEMVIQMNTSMYHHNHFTKDRKVIMKIYLKEYFLFEVLPLIFDGRKSDNLAIDILFLLPLLLKIKGIIIILKNLEFYILQILDNHSIFQLLKLIMQMMLFGHILACAYSLVTAYEVNFFNYVTPWQTRFEDNYENWETKYLQSLYWAFTTMMNVQNMQPTSNLELGFTCVCMLVSCVAFGYLISAIGGILNEINKEQKEYKQDLNILNQFMKRKKIEIGLMRRANIQLKKYYEQQRRVRYIQENETLMKLNEYMMKELLISSNFKIIKRYPFFFSLFTNQTLFKICTKMQEKLYAPSQIIFDKSIEEQDDYYLYLVVSGQIAIEDQFNLQVNDEKKQHNQYYFLEENDKYFEQAEEEEDREHDDKIIGRKLHKGDFFGAKGFFTGRESMQKAISQDFSTVMIISKKDVEKILQEEKRDLERYKEVGDKIMFNNDFSDLKAYCHSCQSKFHYTDQCTKVYFDKDPLFVVLGQNYSSNQERSNCSRGGQKSCTLMNLLRNMETAATVKYDFNLDQMSDIYSNQSQSEESQEENEDVADLPRDNQKQKTLIHKEIHKEESKLYADGILYDDREYRSDQIKNDSKFDAAPYFNMDNAFQNVGNPLHAEDEGVFYEIKQIHQNSKFGVSERDPIISSIDPDTKERIHHQTSINQAMKRGSIDGSLFQKSQVNTISIGKQEYLLKQLLNSLQEMLTSINSRGSHKRKQSAQVGSNLDISSRLGTSAIRATNNIEKLQKNSQFEEYTHSKSRQSMMRNTYRSTSFVTSRKDKQFNQHDYYKELSIKSKAQSHNVSFENQFMWDLDKMQNYEFYFSHFNAQEVIKKYNTFMGKQVKKRKIKKSKFNVNSQLKRSQTQNTRNRDSKSYKMIFS